MTSPHRRARGTYRRDHPLSNAMRVTEKTPGGATFARSSRPGADQGMLLSEHGHSGDARAGTGSRRSRVAARVPPQERCPPPSPVSYSSGGQRRQSRRRPTPQRHMNVSPQPPCMSSRLLMPGRCRALMKTWKGDAGNAEVAQKSLYHRLPGMNVCQASLILKRWKRVVRLRVPGFSRATGCRARVQKIRTIEGLTQGGA